MTLRKFIGLFQFGFLDLAMGAFIAHVLSLALYGSHASLGIYIAGSLMAVLPDFDLLLTIFQKKELDLKHRGTIFHQPLFLALVPGVILTFISPFWALLWIFPLLWHYLHDTFGESMGVPWLYPFSSYKFAFFDFDKKRQWHFFIAHPPSYPGLTLDEAMVKKFYRLTPTSIIEIVLPFLLLTIIAFTW